jgi:hypothetical protein
VLDHLPSVCKKSVAQLLMLSGGGLDLLGGQLQLFSATTGLFVAFRI